MEETCWNCGVPRERDQMLEWTPEPVQGDGEDVQVVTLGQHLYRVTTTGQHSGWYSIRLEEHSGTLASKNASVILSEHMSAALVPARNPWRDFRNVVSVSVLESGLFKVTVTGNPVWRIEFENMITQLAKGD